MNPTTVFTVPDGFSRVQDFEVTVNGECVPVCEGKVAAFCRVGGEGPFSVEVTVPAGFSDAVVRPLSKRIAVDADGKTVQFVVPGPMHLDLEIDGNIKRPLFLFMEAPESEPPEGTGKLTRFGGGKIHDIGVYELEDGETVWIDADTVVRGAFLAEQKRNVAIRGLGIVDGSELPHGTGPGRTRMMRFHDCRNVCIEGVTIVDGPTWHVNPVGCEGVEIRNVKIINGTPNGDGFDLVGSSDVVVDGCFARAKDDCVAIKAMTFRHYFGGKDVENVEVRNCTFWNAEWGNAIEIGYETCCNRMTNIRFRNIDIIRCEEERCSSGGAITIHNGDRAEISHVLYEDIRIEDAQEKLFDLKIQHSRYSRDEVRGQLRDIVFRNIEVVGGQFPPSIIQGWDRDHLVQGLVFEDVVVHGVKFEDFTSARMITEFWRDVEFR